MRSVLTKVVRHIAADQVNGFLADIHRVHQFSATTQGIDRETARVAEHIEYLFVLRIMLQEWAVVALVDEETRLLTAEPVNAEV